MGIRQAKIEDSNSIKKLILEFYEESLKEYKLSFEDNTLDELIKTFTEQYIILVVEKENKIIGIIAGIVTNSLFDKYQKLGQEIIWYITKEERKGTTAIRLLEKFEEECKRRGANIIVMIHMANLNADVLDKLYKMRGFKLAESHYFKEV